jgi:hypothetical protein
MENSQEKAVLRDLAQRYAEVCARPEMSARRDAWRRHNSLRPGRPLIYVRAFAWTEMPESRLVCRDPFLRSFEDTLRYNLFWASLEDDSVFEPWITLGAVHRCTGWGVDIPRRFSGRERGSWKIDYPLKSLEEVDRLRAPWHEIDEEETARRAERLQEAVGDALTVNVDRAPAYRTWSADLSTDLGYLRGIEHFMLDMLENPAGLHRLVRFMAEGVRRTHEQAEAAGDWGLGAHENQAMPYAEELPDPAPNVNGIPRRQLWDFCAAQEFTGVSPALHEEFLLRYQLPILREFGLVAYGCCEDLTRKIDMLRQVPNLRRIAVAPVADVAKCAEQIGGDYVLSYRPSPADMVGYGFDPDRVRRILRRDLEACRHNGCHVDVTLKDVETVEGDPQRVRRWVLLTRQVIDEVFG